MPSILNTTPSRVPPPSVEVNENAVVCILSFLALVHIFVIVESLRLHGMCLHTQSYPCMCKPFNSLFEYSSALHIRYIKDLLCPPTSYAEVTTADQQYEDDGEDSELGDADDAQPVTVDQQEEAAAFEVIQDLDVQIEVTSKILEAQGSEVPIVDSVDQVAASPSSKADAAPSSSASSAHAAVAATESSSAASASSAPSKAPPPTTASSLASSVHSSEELVSPATIEELAIIVARHARRVIG